MPEDHRKKPPRSASTRRSKKSGPSPTPAKPDDLFARVAPFYDRLMDSIPYEGWADYIEKVMKVKGYQPKSILDVACGTGTLTMILASRGYDAAGTDLSRPMLKEARKKAKQAGLKISFHRQDAAKLRLRRKFDLAVSVYDSLNYVLEDEALLGAFKSIRRALHPGGIFFFDLNTLYSFQAELFTQQSREGAQIPYQWNSRFDPFTRIAKIDMHFDPPGEDPLDVVQYQRGYHVSEILELLEAAHFKPLELYEAYTLLPAGPFSERIFYLARKE